MSQQTLLETVSDAIADALKVRAYGLYDYTNYPGDKPPHVVRDELAKPGEQVEIARYSHRDEALEHYEKLCREYTARSALAAINRWMADDFIERQRRMGMR